VTITDAVPTADQEARFWGLVEAAWALAGPETNGARLALSVAPAGKSAGVDEALVGFLERLTASCVALSSEELTDLDRVLERKLYDIDREDIHEFTDGSDDGFLYARGFIVALGRRYYEAVAADPRLAVLDAECEEMCYFFAQLHKERFGTWPATGSGISRESASNQAGWHS
jgi:uncharacterized protein DUF4240